MDHLSVEQRSRLMSRVQSKDTDIELALRSSLHLRGLRFRKHVRELAGTPDVVFPRERIAVFVDGDFWHGYRFPVWQDGLTPFWQQKIRANRARDRRNFAKLRRSGWTVIRVWGHEIKRDIEAATLKVAYKVITARSNRLAK